MSNLRTRWIGRYDPNNRLLRLSRTHWERGVVGDGAGYSAALSFGLHPRLFWRRRESAGWIVTLLGLRVHYQRSYGGRFP